MRLACLTAVLLTLAACPDDEDGNPPGGLEEVPAQLAAAICAARPACDVFSHFGTGNFDCEPRYRAEIENRLLPAWQAAVDSGDAQLDAAGFAACLASLAAGDCHAFDVDDVYACASSVLSGQVVVGEACDIDAECAGAARCDTDGQCPGLCVGLGGEGEACDGNATCADGLQCVGSDPAVCTRRLAPGATCSIDGLGAFCEAGTECNESDEGRTCLTIAELFSRTLGESCTGGFACQEGLYCRVGTGDAVCIEQVAPGAACSTTTIPDSCGAGFKCSSSSGVCEPLPGEGEACLFDCASGLLCSAGRCADGQELGGSCASDAACWSDFCDDGTCALRTCEAS